MAGRILWLIALAVCIIASVPEATPRSNTTPSGGDQAGIAGLVARMETRLNRLQKSIDDIETDRDIEKEYLNRRQSVLEKKLELTLTELLKPRPTPDNTPRPTQTRRPPTSVTPPPVDGDVRLVHPTGCQTQGRLEIFLRSTWGTVCDDNFDNTDATVACRQLGFSNGLVLPAKLPGSGPIWLDEMACSNGDTRLVDCVHSPIGREDCGHDEDVYITCYNGTSRVNCPGEDSVNHGASGDVRLVHPTGCQTEGRLEIHLHGSWGTVCDDNFESVDAKVACRQLGYSNGIRVPQEFPGTGTIWLDEVSCSQTNTRLLDCGHNSIGVNDCGHNEDVYIACYNGTSRIKCPGEQTRNSVLRLVHPTGCQTEGRLEISFEDEWGTVCDDNFDNVDATVACRQMGYSHGIKMEQMFPGSGRIWLDEMSCSPENRRLTDCVHRTIGVHDCVHSEDVYIACYNGISRVCCPGSRAPDVDANSIRLVGGSCPNEGRLEVHHDGTWGTICNDGFGLEEANVACKQLGYDRGITMNPEEGSGRIWLDNLSCNPEHNTLTECDRAPWGSHNCGHAEDIGVTCFNDP